MQPNDVPEIVRAQNKLLQFNDEAIDIYEGNIKPYVEKLVDNQLSAQSAYAAKQRISPINLLPKIVDKLTNIYQTAVLRTVEGGSKSDEDLLDWYVKNMKLNAKMNCANELYNFLNCTLIQPYVYNGVPYIRPIENDKFVVYSENPIQPQVPTHVILIYKFKDQKFFHVYSDEEIYIVNERGEKALSQMAAYGMNGQNPIGKLPFVYANSSEYRLIPCPDDDGLTMLKLIPLMLTDLNHAAMFQAFSILYMINATAEGLKYAPNAIWNVNTLPESDEKPEIGQVKPQVDYQQVMNLIMTELSVWLGTKGIRASAIAGLDTQEFASGVSKMIDEMDTFEARQKQVTKFTDVESQLWDLIINYMHPYWIGQKSINPIGSFTVGAVVNTKFAVQLPMQTRGQVVTDLAVEYTNGFISRKAAISRLNPEMSESKIDELIKQIDSENTVNTAQQPQFNQNGGLSNVAENQPGNTVGLGSGAAPKAG